MKEQRNLTEEENHIVQQQLLEALHNTSPAIEAFHWNIGNNGEGERSDVIKMEVVLAQQGESKSSTYDFLSMLENTNVEELLTLMTKNMQIEGEETPPEPDEVADDLPDNTEEAEFREVDEENGEEN